MGNKKNILWIIIILMAIVYWVVKDKEIKLDENTSPVLRNVQLIDKNNSDNFFAANFDSLNIDFKEIQNISGEWKVEQLPNGDLSFLTAYLELEDKIVFRDSISSILTGWGIIELKSSVKIYSSEFGGRVFEYLVLKKGVLRFIEYEYRDDDLNFFEIPKLKSADFNILMISENLLKMEFRASKKKVILKRKVNAP